jgi:hypothetical protein
VTEVHVSLMATAGLGGPETLPNEEVLHSVHRGNKEAAFYSGFVIRKEPSDGLEPSTPSLPWNFSGKRWQPVATDLAYFCGLTVRRICH